MTIQEIFNLPEIEEIEEEMILLSKSTPNDHEIIKRLLPIRKRLLNQHFAMDGQYKLLLPEFNEAMRLQLTEMRKETIKTYNAVAGAGIRGVIETVGKCFLGYKYPPNHPVQTDRAIRM